MRARSTHTIATLAFAGCILSCSSSPNRSATPTKADAHKDAGSDAARSDPRWLAGHLITQVPEGTFGPYVAHSSNGALAFFAPSSSKERKWYAQALASSGAPVGIAKEVGRAPDDAPVVVVRAAASRDGFVALWVRRNEQGQTLEAVVIDADGKPRSEASTVVQVSGQIVWADVVNSGTGMVVVWAEQRRDKAAISSARLETTGRVTGSPTLLAPAARAWQIMQTATGFVLVMVRAQEGTDAGATIVEQLLDASGHPVGQPITVSESPTAALDVDVARLGNTLVLAWTDRREVDGHVFVAATDLNGRVTTAPHALTAALGDQSFVGLVAARSGAEALLVYEDLSQRMPQKRALRLTTVDAKGAAGPVTVHLDYPQADRDLPEFVASPDGFAILTNAPICTIDRPCDNSSTVPTYVRLNASLSVIGSSPLLVDKLAGQVPTNAWALGCTREQCTAMATGLSIPAPVVTVPLPARKSTYASPVQLPGSASAPFAVSNQVIRSVDQRLSEVSAAQVGDNTLVGWVTYFVEPPVKSSAPANPAPKGAKTLVDPAAAAIPGDPKKPTAAKLSVLALDPSGKALGVPTVISVRALSAGGLSISPGAPNNKDACIAWVARDEGDPQVFVTRVAADGKREAQQMLTRVRGEASDAAVVWAGDGWVIGWIDMRDGNGEVYVAKVDRQLRKVVQDTRITNAAGDASDVGLFARGNDVYVTWSDPREHVNDGHGDPYVQKLQAATLARAGQETRLDQSPLHARSVHVSASGPDLIAGWLAQPVNDATTDRSRPAGPRLVRIDPKTTAPAGDVALLRGEAGRLPNSFGFVCTDDMCKGVMAGSVNDTLRVESVTWFPSSPAMQSKPLTTLSGPPGEDVFPSLVGDQVFFADEANSGEVRIRRAKIQWAAQ